MDIATNASERPPSGGHLGRVARLRFQPLNWLIGSTRSEQSMTYLDGLRGLAVLYVILGHYALFDPTGFWLKAIAPGATSGVHLFFLLSSFLLTRLLINALQTSGPRLALLSYFRRRFLRIYPMFAATLIVVALVPDFYQALFVHQQVSLYEIFFLTNARSIFWAISVEMEFYLLLPLFGLTFVAAGTRLKLALLLILVAAFVGQSVHHDLHPGLFPNGYPHVWPYLSIFALGAALAVSAALVHDGALAKPPIWLATSVFCVGLAGQLWSLPLGGMLTLDDFVSNRWHVLVRDQGGNAFLWGCVLFGFLYGDDLPRRLFSNTWMRWIGAVSYSAYLTHILVARQIMSPLLLHFGFYASIFVCVAVTLALSTLTFTLIERPFIRMR